MIKTVKKVWGNEQWLLGNELYFAKFLNIESNYRLSFHTHKEKDEVFYVLGGEIELKVLNLEGLLPENFDQEIFYKTLSPYKEEIISKMKTIVL